MSMLLRKFKPGTVAALTFVAISLPALAAAQEVLPEGERDMMPEVRPEGAPATEAEPGARPEPSRESELLAELAAAPSPEIADRAERDLRAEWSKSGSAAMDLLLKRGRDALEVGEIDTAIGHLTALTDHAPGFAEGWSTLALAYYAADRLGPAMDALEHTLALNPNHFGALQGVGAIHEELGDLDLAYRAYSRVVELRPYDENVTEAIDRLEMQVNGVSL